MRYKRPDRKNALSILEAAERDMKYTLTIKPTPESGSTIVRNIYESFRMLVDALLVAKGIESEDPITPIKELTSLRINTKRPLNTIDNLRRLRHNINYYGYKPKQQEVEDALSIVNAIFGKLLKKIRGIISE